MRKKLKNCANMNELEDLWEMKDLSKRLKQYWVGFCINKNQGGRREMGRIEYGVPRIVRKRDSI